MAQIFDFSMIEPILKDPDAKILFEKLLDAVIADDFSKVGALSSELLYDYIYIRQKVEDLIYNKFYESVYESDVYISLLNFMIDLYSIFLTMITIRKNLTHIRMQPDEIVDSYLDMFGFPSKHLFNYIHRREIAEKIYGFLRKKGTPESLKMILNFLGYDDHYIAEYWVADKDDLKFKPELIYNTTKNTLLTDNFLRSLGVEKNTDPLWIQTKNDILNLLNTNKASLPIRSPYYGVGSIMDDARTFKIFCAFNAVLIRKLMVLEFNGTDIQTISPSHYTAGKLSYIDLLLGWAYVMDRMFNSTWITSTIYDALNNRISWAYSWNLDYSKSLSEVYLDIVAKVDELFKPINTKNKVVDLETWIDIPKSPLEDKVDRFSEISNTFYNISEFDSILKTRDAFIEYFSNRNFNYFNFLKNEMDSHPLNMYGSIDYISTLLEAIADEIEYYLYDVAKYKIPIKQLTLTYYRFFKSMAEVDKSFTPYHATFLELNMLFVIQDFPGDQIVFNDYKVNQSGKILIIDHLNHVFDNGRNNSQYYFDTIFSQDMDKREVQECYGTSNLIDPVAYNILWTYDVNDPFSHFRNIYEYDPPYKHECNNFFDKANHTRFDFVELYREKSEDAPEIDKYQTIDHYIIKPDEMSHTYLLMRFDSPYIKPNMEEHIIRFDSGY